MVDMGFSALVSLLGMSVGRVRICDFAIIRCIDVTGAKNQGQRQKKVEQR